MTPSKQITDKKGTISQKCIPLDSPDEWRGALKGIKHAFAHTWENCYAMQLSTGLKTYLYCFETEGVRIVCPVAERDFEGYIDIVTPYGFSGFVGRGEHPQFSRYWRSFVKQKGYVCGYIGLNPVFESGAYYEPNEPFEYNEIYVLDLTSNVDELFNKLSKNRKRQVRQWEEGGSAVILDRGLLTEFFIGNYSDFFHRKQSSQVYNLSKETVQFILSLDEVFVVGAGEVEAVEAVTVFAYTPHTADFLFNVSLPDKQHYSASLLWYGLNHLKSLQVPSLNLGGGVRKNDGVAGFKQRFGSKTLPLKSLKQVYKPKIYEELCLRTGADPNDMTGYFPAYRNSGSWLTVADEA